MSEAPRRILVDTNVWLDYFIPSRRGRSVAIEFLRDACTVQVDLLYAATSSKDLFYLISSEHKAWYRREHGSLSQDAAVAATSLAWDCLSVLSQLATSVPCDLSDIWMASRQRELHSDYEDDLIIAAAIRSQADLLVTNDAKLCSHAPVAAMSVEDAKNYLATL
jgi:predicted nucleic acid-binding protein